HLFKSLVYNCPFAAVRIKTGISGRSATAWIIRNDVVNKISVARVSELMRFTRLEEKSIALSYNCRSIFVSDTAATGNDEIKFRFSRVQMIRTQRFSFRDPHQREIKRMPLGQIERLRFTAECNRNILHEPMKLAFRRSLFLLSDILQIYFAHMAPFLITIVIT